MDANQDDGYEGFWGQAATPLQPRIGLVTAIAVPETFYWGPFMRGVQEATGRMDAQAAQEFVREALLRWLVAHRGPAVGPGRTGLKQLVPTPMAGMRSVRIRADLDGAVDEDEFSRVVGRRFGATEAGKRLALREAILEALRRALGPRPKEGPWRPSGQAVLDGYGDD